MQLIAKMCPSGHSDKAWTWVAPAAMEAHNAAIHNPMAQGSIGVSPSEMMHGAKPRVKSMIMAEQQENSAQHADPGNREFVEAIAHAPITRHVNMCCNAERRMRSD